MHKLNLPDSLAKMNKAESLIDVDINKALEVFTDALHSAAECLLQNHNGAKP